LAKVAKSKQEKKKKQVPKNQKFSIDCSQPVEDEIFDIVSFEKFLRERMKVNNKAGQLGDSVTLAREGSTIHVNTNKVAFSKRYLKYLTKKFLKKQLLREYIRVVARTKNGYFLRYFNFHKDDGTGEESKEKKLNVRSNDLYIPLMAFVTYVLVCGLTRGTLDDFHPEILSSTASFASALLGIEVIGTKTAFYFGSRDGKRVTFLDLLSISGYKFVCLVGIVSCGLFTGGNGIAYWLSFVYCSLSTAIAMRLLLWFTLSTQSGSPRSEWNVGASKGSAYVCWGIAAVQLPILWLLTPSWEGKLRL